MKGFFDAIISIAVIGGILVGSAILTNLYAKKMYDQCSSCHSLNAKRRTHCRVCGHALREDQEG